jgi:hypothetical protein
MISTLLRITICVVALAGLGWSVALRCGACEQQRFSDRWICTARSDVVSVQSASVQSLLLAPDPSPILLPVVDRSLSLGGVIAVHVPVNMAILLFALTSILTVLPLVRRFRRRRSGCCVWCGYDLRGAESAFCSECGALVSQGTERL